jgi:hypothetical protein
MSVRSLIGATALVLLLAGCAGAGTPGGEEGGDDQGSTEQGGIEASDAITAAADLVQQRYDLVRDGDYAGACELYSEEFAALFAELAETEGKPCVEAHEAGVANATTYLETAAEQERAGLTPFFYVPTEIEIDPTAITSDRDDVAFLGEGVVVSLDPREFEDGVGKTPGWLAAQVYVMRGDDGQWRFISPSEK